MIELAYLRNRLSKSKFDNEDSNILNDIKNKISLSSSPFREIGLNAIDNCEKDIERKELRLASCEINFIHNFPFDGSKKWDEKHFYTIELLRYLEEVDDFERIKKWIF